MYSRGRGDNVVEYEIRELLTTGELRAEGSAMRHCVASYAQRCRTGGVAIYSLTRKDKLGRRRSLTIAIHPLARTIAEASGVTTCPRTSKVACSSPRRAAK